MGRYYKGDVNGKFMTGVQWSDAHERFGAVEENTGYVDYVVYRGSYNEILKELNKIDKESIERVKNMFDKVSGYNDGIQRRFQVTNKDLSDYADYIIGMELKEFFDNNKHSNQCSFVSEF